MKRLLVCMGLFVATAATLSAQNPPASPAATETTVLAGKTVTISYSSPGVKGRAGHLFGKDGKIGQDPTYPVWRAGANSATKLHTDADHHRDRKRDRGHERILPQNKQQRKHKHDDDQKFRRAI